MSKREIDGIIREMSPGGVIILDAPSGYGKTYSLLQIKKYNPEDVLILSYEELVRDICRYLKNDNSSKKMIEEFSRIIKQFRIFAIEDIDFLAGKIYSLADICLLVNKIVEYQTTIVVITGIDVYDKMPYFVDRLNNLTYVKLS